MRYIATLAGEAVREVPIAGVSIEGLGQLGVAHNGLHEKTDGAYGPAAQRILSVCCCAPAKGPGSQGVWIRTEVIGRLRDALAAVQAGDCVRRCGDGRGHR